MRNRFLGHSIPDTFADTSGAIEVTLQPTDTAFYFNDSRPIQVYPIVDASANRAELNFLESLGLLYESNGAYYRIHYSDLLYEQNGLFQSTDKKGVLGAIQLFYHYVLPGRANRARQIGAALPNAIYTGRALQQEELEALAEQDALARLLQIPSTE